MLMTMVLMMTKMKETEDHGGGDDDNDGSNDNDNDNENDNANDNENGNSRHHRRHRHRYRHHHHIILVVRVTMNVAMTIIGIIFNIIASIIFFIRGIPKTQRLDRPKNSYLYVLAPGTGIWKRLICRMLFRSFVRVFGGHSKLITQPPEHPKP